MKAVIASPPVLDFYFTPTRSSAIGAEALKKILLKNGIETVSFNFPLLKKKPSPVAIPPELEYLSDFIIPGEYGPLSWFTRYHHFGPSMEDCARLIAAELPQIIFISCFAWAYASETVELAAEIKKILPGIPVTAGGAGVSVNPGWFDSSPVIDHVITGEAEASVPDFLENIFGIPAVKSEEPDNPGFHWSETGLSVKKNTRYISAILSRGCPKACRFCSNHLVHGRKFRKASLEDVISGLNEIPDDHNIHMNFEDDNLLFDREYFLKIIREVKKIFPMASFTAENGLDYTLMDSDLVSILINSGFRSFNFSMASSDTQLLRQERREADLNKLRTVTESASAAGAGSTIYFICGLEGDTPESTVENLRLLHEMPGLTGISLFYPVPGLPGFIPETLAAMPPRLCAGSSARPWTNSLSTAQLITSFRLARLSNLIKTVEGRIPSITERTIHDAEINKLIDTIHETGRLHTLVNHRTVEIPYQDKTLVSTFLDSVYKSID